MKTTSKTLLLAAALTLALAGTLAVANPSSRGNPGQAGEHQRGPGMHAAKMHAMAGYLGLTDEQKASFKAVQEKQQASLQALHADPAITAEQRRSEAHAIHANFEAQRQALLTPEQKEKAEAMKSAVKERVQRRIKQQAPQIAEQETQAFLREHMRQQRGK